MKKQNPKSRRRQILLEFRRKRKQIRVVNKRRHLRYQSVVEHKRHAAYYSLRASRDHIRRIVYKNRSYDGDKQQIVVLNGEVGIEDSSGIDYFLDAASTFIDFNSKELIFDLTKCTRMWPTGITLLCSLTEWVELTSTKNHRPRLASTPSSDVRVNSYLADSGFYGFVKRGKDTDESFYSNEEIVKIQREVKAANIEEREAEFVELLKKFSRLNQEEIELFDSKVLTEVFANITEHGVTHRDKGWWVLAQHHQKHGILSLCFADNGIGIRNSLMTGPQREEIGKKITNISDNDGVFIRLAIDEIVTGALAAEIKPKRFGGRYVSGARRGNGLKRIRSTCEQLQISFSILSHFGYAFISQNGQYTKIGSREKRVFAGTLYHFTIPTN